MKLINNLQVEVTQIVVRTNELLNKRIIDFFKRRVWIENIADTSEYSYRAEVYYIGCGCLIMNDGEIIKTKESYEELSETLNKVYLENIQRNEAATKS